MPATASRTPPRRHEIMLPDMQPLAAGRLPQTPEHLQPLDLATQLLARHHLPGRLGRLQHTIDPDVRRCPLILSGRVWALIYINLHHQRYIVIRRGQDAHV